MVNGSASIAATRMIFFAYDNRANRAVAGLSSASTIAFFQCLYISTPRPGTGRRPSEETIGRGPTKSHPQMRDRLRLDATGLLAQVGQFRLTAAVTGRCAIGLTSRPGRRW